MVVISVAAAAFEGTEEPTRAQAPTQTPSHRPPSLPPARPPARPLPSRPQSFRSIFAVDAWRAACESAGGGVKGTLKAYREVLDHLSEGLRFYMSLQVRMTCSRREV
jgi:hypothetical protein